MATKNQTLTALNGPKDRALHFDIVNGGPNDGKIRISASIQTAESPFPVRAEMLLEDSAQLTAPQKTQFQSALIALFNECVSQQFPNP